MNHPYRQDNPYREVDIELIAAKTALVRQITATLGTLTEAVTTGMLDGVTYKYSIAELRMLYDAVLSKKEG